MLGNGHDRRRLWRAVFPFPFLRITGGWVDALGSAGILLLVAASRLLLLPRGPWEQDEALLACGVGDFDPAHHMPLPPGFPLWILIGRLTRLLGVGDPVTALQVASALLSVVAVWALVGLWGAHAGPAEAVAGALLAAFLPGVWFHAARGFSETAAATFAVVGLALWLRGGRQGFAAGSLAMTAAALTRPPLAPLFVVAVLLAAWGVRREPRRLAAAAALCGGAVVAVLAPLVLEAGGTTAFLSAIRSHGGEHFALLGLQPWRVADIGFVRGLGTPAAALLFFAAAAVGWWTLRRALGWRFWAGSGFAVFLAYLLLFLHNRSYPRYWVLAWLLLAVPAAVGARVVVRSVRVAVPLVVLGAAVAAWWTWPAVRYLHRHRLPVVEALEAVAGEGAGVLVFEDQLFSFRNYYAKQRLLRVGSLRVSEIPPRRLNLGGSPLWFLTESEGQDVPSNASQALVFACPEPRVARLSQDRFLRARLVRNPVLAWRGASVPEVDSTERFIWCSGRSVVVLPPVGGAGQVALACEIHPLLGQVEVAATMAGRQVFRERRAAGRQVLVMPLPDLPERNRLNQIVPLELAVEREVQLAGDLRRLAVRLYRVSVEAPPYPVGSYAFFPETNSLLAAAVAGTGTYPPEALGDPPRPAAWTGPVATFSMPLGTGLVGVEVLAPRPGPVPVTATLGATTSTLRVGPEGGCLVLAVPPELAHGRRGTLVVESPTFVPGGDDRRELGVAISRIWFAAEP